MKKPQQQLCINHCSQARNNQPCATCLLSTAVSSREEDTAFEIAELHNKCRTTQVIADLEQSIETSKALTAKINQSNNRADLIVLAWAALALIVAVMWALGHSTPVKICGGV